MRRGRRRLDSDSWPKPVQVAATTLIVIFLLAAVILGLLVSHPDSRCFDSAKDGCVFGKGIRVDH